jgi:hypothetical protein
MLLGGVAGDSASDEDEDEAEEEEDVRRSTNEGVLAVCTGE